MRASPLSADGVARLAAALGEPVEPVAPLHGGVSSSVYQLATPTRRLVLKRFRFADAAPLEWERLHVARAVAVPTPEPLVLDAEGAWFGVPALVVIYLEGESMYPPQAETLGSLLAVIHGTPPFDPPPASLARPALWQMWEPPASVGEFPAGVVAAIRDLQAIAPSLPAVVSHCDFHPGNVIVSDDGAVTGVVDWSNMRITPAGFDVGLARCDLAIEPGGDAPEVFLAAYQAARGEVLDHLPLWDALGAARALEHGHGWVEAWTDTGVPMTAERIRERVTTFAEAAVAAHAAS